MDKLLLKPEEAALLLGIGRSKLYELSADGAIASVRTSRNKRRCATCTHRGADDDMADELDAAVGRARTD